MWRKRVVNHEVSHNQRALNNIAPTRCTYKVRLQEGRQYQRASLTLSLDSRQESEGILTTWIKK